MHLSGMNSTGRRTVVCTLLVLLAGACGSATKAPTLDYEQGQVAGTKRRGMVVSEDRLASLADFLLARFGHQIEKTFKFSSSSLRSPKIPQIFF